MNCEIIAVGTELTTGDINNTNASFLSRELTAMGIKVTSQTAVDDSPERIVGALGVAVGRSQIIILTGGLGPTPDDLTKETVCGAVGLELARNEDSFDRIKKYFELKGTEMPAINEKQAFFPKDCRVFPNNHGTADGCAIESGNQRIIMLPGPPSELQPMFEESVKPYLCNLLDRVIVTKTLKVFGMGESSVSETISELLKMDDPIVATYVGDGGDIRIKITSTGTDRKECEEKCGKAADVIRQRLSDVVYDENGHSLAEAVVSRLLDRNMKIATAESCTAGLLSKTLTDVSGASRVFEYGISAYANRVKAEMLEVDSKLLETVGEYSPEVAEAMAKGARAEGKADIGIGITGIAGPDGGTAEKPVGLVYVSLFDGEKYFTRRLDLPASKGRDAIRLLTVMNALDMVRLYLDNNKKFMDSAVCKQPDSVSNNTDAVNEALSDGPASDKDEPKGLKKFLRSVFPCSGDSTSQKIRKIILIVCVIVFACSAGYIIDYVYQSIKTHNENGKIGNLYNENISELDENGINKRFYPVIAVNPDTVGWLSVPNTKTNNPVVQSTDNDKYLKTTFQGEQSKYGTLFADYRNVFGVGEKLSQNTIIYGHHMKDGEMMGELKKYRSLDFYKENPSVQFTTIYSAKTVNWKVFSVFVINANPEDDNGNLFEYLRTDFADEEDFNTFINECYQRSIINTAVTDVSFTDRILTLSTCVYDFDNARLVIMARECRDGEDASVDTSNAQYNPDPVYPAAYYSKNGGSGRTTVSKTASESSSEAAPSSYPDVSSRPNVIPPPSFPDASKDEPSLPDPIIDPDHDDPDSAASEPESVPEPDSKPDSEPSSEESRSDESPPDQTATEELSEAQADSAEIQ